MIWIDPDALQPFVDNTPYVHWCSLLFYEACLILYTYSIVPFAVVIYSVFENKTREKEWWREGEIGEDIREKTFGIRPEYWDSIRVCIDHRKGKETEDEVGGTFYHVTTCKASAKRSLPEKEVAFPGRERECVSGREVVEFLRKTQAPLTKYLRDGLGRVKLNQWITVILFWNSLDTDFPFL